MLAPHLPLPLQVKSANILLNASWEAKLCDFNLSEILRQHGPEPADGGAINPTWMVCGEIVLTCMGPTAMSLN